MPSHDAPTRPPTTARSTRAARERIDLDRVAAHWPDILRVVASIHTATVTAHDIIRVLSRDGNLTQLGEAIAHYGASPDVGQRAGGDRGKFPKAVAKIIDDLDVLLEFYNYPGSGEDVATIRFSLDGADFEIDLNPANADRLRDQLARFVEHASPVRPSAGKTRRARASRPAASGTDQVRAIRDWAIANGYQVSARGRVPRSVVAAFDAAH